MTYSQEGGIGKHASPPCTTITKNIAILQNKCHPELSENQAVWKSDNQGFKEATFIQMGRRGGVVEMGGEAVRAAAKWVVPHSHVVDKNQKGDF